MKTRNTLSRSSIAVMALALVLTSGMALADAPASVTGAGAAAFPSGASLNGVNVSAMRFALGVDIVGDGSAAGDFQSTLLGAQGRKLVVEGRVSAGSAAVAGAPTFSGLCSLDTSDGAAAATGIPFSVTVGTGADGKPALTLVVGGTALPAASVTGGTLSSR